MFGVLIGVSGLLAWSAAAQTKGGPSADPGSAVASQQEPGVGAAPPIAHPTKAICRVCEAKGGAHGREDVAAWRERNGTMYYFCAEACAAEFDANPAAYERPRFPRPAPDGLVRTLEGAKVTLASLRGGVTLVDFWATWCKPCLKSMPKIQELHDALSSKGFRAVGVSIDENGDETVTKFVQKKKLTYPIVIDDESAPSWAAFSVIAIPAMFLIDREGQIVSQWTGEVDWKEVEAAIQAAIAAPAD
jgi:peroxiredoxin